MVAPVDELPEGVRRPQRQENFDDPALERACRDETRVGEHAQHRCVRGEHLGNELLDAHGRTELREPFQQACSDPTALELVGDGECNLGTSEVAKADVARERDNFVGVRPEQCASLDPVGLEHRLDQPLVERGVTVEPEIKALVRQSAKEPEHRSRVARTRCAQSHGRAVAENDVNRRRSECLGAHVVILRRTPWSPRRIPPAGTLRLSRKETVLAPG